MRGIVLATSLVLSAAGASVVHAQPAKVDKDKAKIAKEYVDAGLAAQNAKDYDTAITLYSKAYDLVPHPVLLFNMGQAHRLAGRVDDAIASYEKYLAADPNGPQAKSARDFLTELKAKRAAEKKRAEEARKADDAKKAEEARKADEARAAEEARKADEARVAAEREREEAANRPGRGLRIGGIAAGGVGIVAVGAAIVFGMRASKISDELSVMGAVFDPAKVSDGEDAERNAIIAGAAGGALIVGGVVMYYLGHRARSSARVEQISLLLGNDVIGVAIIGGLP